MTGTASDTVLALLKRLQDAHISYTLAHNQEDAISILIAVPGQRWEVDCHADGAIDVEVFKSDGSIRNEVMLETLFRDFSD